VKVAPPEAAFCGACSGGKSDPPPDAPLCSAQREQLRRPFSFQIKSNKSNKSRKFN
jgi:hypothetical protein